MAGGSRKVIIISLCANFGIALSKLGGALYTGSAALLAEAVHSFSDCGNQALLLHGQRAAGKPPTPQYPLGRSKELFFWSFVVALLLFTMGGMFSLYEGIHKLWHPQALESPMVGVVILLVAVGLEGYSFYACLREVRHQNHDGSLWRWVRRTNSADLLVIFLEDLAALLGLLMALSALGLAWITGSPLWDAAGSCVIGVLLIGVAVVLAREVKSMLIGEMPSHDYQADMEELLAEVMPGARLLRLIALQQGVNAVLLAYKIAPGQGFPSTQQAIDAINCFEREVRVRHPEIQWQFAELDDHA